MATDLKMQHTNSIKTNQLIQQIQTVVTSLITLALLKPTYCLGLGHLGIGTGREVGGGAYVLKMRETSYT